MVPIRRSLWLACVLSAFLGGDALAFTHVVLKTDTLAQIAERIYGRIQYEKVLVAANALDAQGGSPIVPGERLEIPAVTHHRVTNGESWASLGLQLLGDTDRADTLARANDSMPWIPPAEGAEIVVPYNLRYIVGQTDTLVTIAQKFTGEKDRAWIIDRYNHLKGQALRRGDVLLIPLTDLPLTPSGKEESALSDASLRTQSSGGTREAQRRVEAELPALLSDMRGARYVDAVARGAKMLASGDLTKQQLGTIYRQLTEAYVALEAPGLAAAACASWKENEPKAKLDNVQISPKVWSVCSKSLP